MGKSMRRWVYVLCDVEMYTLVDPWAGSGAEGGRYVGFRYLFAQQSWYKLHPSSIPVLETVLSATVTANLNTGWRRAYTLLACLCVVLILFVGIVDVVHVHRDGTGIHTHSCSLCSITHAGVTRTTAFNSSAVLRIAGIVQIE